MSVPVAQCRGTSRTGKQCKNKAIPGGTVCRFHGGASPHVASKAAVRAEVMAFGLDHRKRPSADGEPTCASSCGRATALRLASCLAVSQPRWDATTSWSRTPRRRRANGHERRRPDVDCCSWLLYDVLGPTAARGSREPS